ncbi:hypothetical protein TOC8171_07250 [Pseudomonas syringae]
MTSLNPLHSVEKQINEVLGLHKGLTGKAATARTLELLELVGIPEPHKRLKALPHELSGGQRQRVMIAMALANEPELLIADEPTTALDVTVQLKILELLKQLQARLGMALLLISHDLNVVRQIANRVCVMQRGCIVEQASCEELFRSPQHPYTKVLLSAEPSGGPSTNPAGAPLLEVEDLKVWFPIKKRPAQAHGRPRQGGGRHWLQSAARANTGYRGRKRVGQIDAGAGDSTTDWQPGHHTFQGQRARISVATANPTVAQADAGGVPGPVWQFEPAHVGG